MLSRSGRVLGAAPGIFTKSTIPTLHFQKSMPRLPLPKLDVSLDAYLTSVSPLLSDEEVANTKTILEEFKVGDGKQLQANLESFDKANPHTSFYNKDWGTEVYLSARSPLPIGWNPYLVAKEDLEKTSSHTRAAAVVASACWFRKSLAANELPPEIFETKGPMSKGYQRFVSLLPSSVSWYAGYMKGVYALDMSQYGSLFNSTRIPGQGTDSIEGFGRNSKYSNTVAVLYKGHVFSLEVCDSNGIPYTEGELAAGFKAILESGVETNPLPVGVLTTQNRDDWAKAREHMVRSEVNKDNLAAIDQSLFVISLDDNDTSELRKGLNADPAKLTEYGINFLHGKGGANRWFDKSLNLIFSKSGSYCCNFEHAWGDGVAVLRFVVDTVKDSAKRTVPTDGKVAKAPRKLEWEMDDALKHTIETAAKDMTAYAGTMDNSISISNEWGKEQFAAIGAKFDPFFQTCMGATYYGLHKEIASQYESASTSGFRGGRTDCIRGNSAQSAAFARSLAAGTDSKETQLELMQKAMKEHSTRTVAALSGKGFERHLFGLKMQSVRDNKPLPALFSDPAYAKLNSNMLSTSSLASDELFMGGFGPVSPGYGVGYGSAGAASMLSISSFKLSPNGYINAFWETLDRMADLQKMAPKAPKKK